MRAHPVLLIKAIDFEKSIEQSDTRKAPIPAMYDSALLLVKAIDFGESSEQSDTPIKASFSEIYDLHNDVV